MLKFAQHFARHRRIHLRFAAHGAAHGLGQIVAGGIFQQIAHGSRANAVKDPIVGVVSGKDDDLRPGQRRHDLPRGLNAVQTRHLDVHQNHIGLQLLRQIHRFDAIGGLTDHLQIRLMIQDDGQTRANDILIVGEKNSNLVGHKATLTPTLSRRGRGNIVHCSLFIAHC